MAIVPRAGSVNGAAQTSPSLTMSTVTGMVIGVLGLFILVVVYQLVPCLHRKKPPANVRTRIPVAPPPERKFSPARIFSKCVTFHKPSKPAVGPTPPEVQTHKSLRSLHLPSHWKEKRSRRTAREKFATRRLGLYIPSPADIFPSRTARDRRHFTQLDESLYSGQTRNASSHTEKPAAALMSPWSPREQDFPYSSAPTPSQWMGGGWISDSPPPFSPPPAYVPGTPIRGGAASVQKPSYFARDDRTAISQHVGPPAPNDNQNAIDLSGVVVVQPRSIEPSSNVFVISDDMDCFSDTSSRSSTWSSRTVEIVL